MIDINELRRLMQDFKLAGSPMLVQTSQMSELLDRLEAAEKERDWNAERLEDAIEECAALRAKIEAMEQQKPIAEWIENRFDCYPQLVWADDYKVVIGTKLYDLPGAKGE
jgi:hypothetical protein